MFQNIMTQNLDTIHDQKKFGSRDHPDLEGLKQFTSVQMAWSPEQFHEQIDPLLKKMTKPKKSKINFYFQKKTKN